MHAAVIIFFRWLHLVTACVAVGGVFFLRVILPMGLRALEPAAAKTVLLKTRRVFKMVIHTAILLFLISGTYSAVLNWHGYTAAGPGIGHGLFGIHVLLALIFFGIALWLLAGPEPPVNHNQWMAVNLALLLFTIAAASTLKYVREHAVSTMTLLPTPASTQP